MSSRVNKELYEAVCFFGKKSILKEMRYSEFEAILDGVVGDTELANKEVYAAYVKVTPTLHIHSVVTFKIEFDDRGFADNDWNIPLRHLAESASAGPDLGVGPIRLACRGQCSVPWYQRELWEPNQSDVDHFQLLKDAIVRNKLGFISTDMKLQASGASLPLVVNQESSQEDDIPLISDTVDLSTLTETQSNTNGQERNHPESLEKVVSQSDLETIEQQYEKQMVDLEEKYLEEIEYIKRAMRNEAQAAKRSLQDLEQHSNQNQVLLEKLQSRNARLERERLHEKEQLDAQKEQYDQLKDDYLDILRSQQAGNDEKTKENIKLKDLLTEKAAELDLIKEQHIAVKASNSELADKLESYRKQRESIAVSSSTELAELNSQLEQKNNESAELKAKVEALEGDQTRLTELLDERSHDLERNRLTLISLESDLKLEKSVHIEMQEALKVAEFNLQDLQQKYDDLIAAKEALTQEISDREEESLNSKEWYARMDELELVFVAYHPGAGHISLPVRQLEDYLERPLGFAAQKCGVTLSHYESWLSHYDKSECEKCGTTINRIDTPSDFQPGISNRCVKHRSLGDNVTMFRKTS